MNSKKPDSKRINNVKPTQIVMIAHDSLLEHDKQSTSKRSLLELRHPKTGEGRKFFLNESSGDLYELVIFKEDCRSWFIGDSVQSDGSLYFVTPVDPVFLIVPYLIRAAAVTGKNSAGSGLFKQIDCILDDANYADTKLLSGCCLDDLHLVASVKGSDDYIVYKYEESLTLEWLKAKVDRVTSALQSHHVSTTLGSSTAATFTRSSKYADSSQDEYTRYACDLIGEYLIPELLIKLKNYLQIPLTDENDNPSPVCDEPAAKKCKLGEVPSPTEDYSSLADKSTNKKTGDKMTAAQRVLSKADTTGMKTLSSFFISKTVTRKK